MQRFVHERSEHHEASVIESCAELRCDNVKVVSVADGHGALVRGEQGLIGSAAGRIAIGEVQHVVI